MCIHCLIAILVSRQGQWKPRAGWRNRAVKFGYLVKTGQLVEARTFAKSVQTQKLTDSFWNVWTHDLTDLVTKCRYSEARYRCLC